MLNDIEMYTYFYRRVGGSWLRADDLPPTSPTNRPIPHSDADLRLSSEAVKDSLAITEASEKGMTPIQK